MKKAIILSVLSLISTFCFAQKDEAARAILNKVSEKYKQYDVIKTDFDFILDNQQANVKEKRSGTLLAKPKANKFKVSIYGSDEGSKQEIEQEIISDGKTQWTYLKKDNEVQINNTDNSANGVNPAQIFTIYEHGYKYIYNGTVRIAGKLYDEIDLSPEEDKQFFKVRLEIDKAKKQIYSALIFDKNGNQYTYVLRAMVPNIQVPDNTFSFDPKLHKGIDVVDLR